MFPLVEQGAVWVVVPQGISVLVLINYYDVWDLVVGACFSWTSLLNIK